MGIVNLTTFKLFSRAFISIVFAELFFSKNLEGDTQTREEKIRFRNMSIYSHSAVLYRK